MSSSAYNCKLVVLGETAVGKSSIVEQFVRGDFNVFQESTIGGAFYTRTIEVGVGRDSKKIKYEIWDTAGQERYRSLAPMYYRGALAIIIVYDITSPESYKKAEFWLNELIDNAPDGKKIIYLVGNKVDLNNQRQIQTEVAKEYARKKKIKFIETSAKIGYNINEIFYEIGSDFIDQKLYKKYEPLSTVIIGDFQSNPHTNCPSCIN